MDKEIYDNSKRCFEGSCTMRAYMSHMKGMMRSGKIILPFVLSFLLAIGALAKGGDLLWDDQFDNGGGSNEALAITAQGNMVYAAGFGGGTTVGEEEFVVRAYDAKTGDLLWDDQFDKGGGFNVAFAITAQGNMVYAAGFGETAGGDFEFVVRAYDAR